MHCALKRLKTVFLSTFRGMPIFLEILATQYRKRLICGVSFPGEVVGGSWGLRNPAMGESGKSARLPKQWGPLVKAVSN